MLMLYYIVKKFTLIFMVFDWAVTNENLGTLVIPTIPGTSEGLWNARGST